MMGFTNVAPPAVILGDRALLLHPTAAGSAKRSNTIDGPRMTEPPKRVDRAK
jgi:hypothetical protein